MDAAKVELLRALGQVVRGLSTLFWGLPLTLLIYMETAGTDWLEFLGPLAFLPAIALSVVLWYGLHQLRVFQKQERIWLQAINRAEVLAVINAGLAPFLFWWRRVPFLSFYIICVAILAACTLLLLMQINYVLRRLSAMLPDETLRAETKMFTTLNIGMLLIVLLGVCAYVGLEKAEILPPAIERIISVNEARGVWFILFLTLMPLAMTMALLWKIKEIIFTSIFEAEL